MTQLAKNPFNDTPAELHRRVNAISPQFQETLVLWRRQFPEITEQEALADLWSKGYMNEETRAAYDHRIMAGLNYENGVISSPDELTGWHVGWVEEWKKGVLKFFATRSIAGGTESMNGFIGLDVLRVAIETHVIRKPNGYTMP